MMTRKEAVDHIWGLSMQVASEFCCGRNEQKALEQQTQEAIDALEITNRGDK